MACSTHQVAHTRHRAAGALGAACMPHLRCRSVPLRAHQPCPPPPTHTCNACTRASQEFQPWLKWIIFDAVLTLVVGRLVKHAEFTRPLFEAIGWV